MKLQILALACLLAAAHGLSSNETEARVWFENVFSPEHREILNEAVEANWQYQTNITSETEKAEIEARLKSSNFMLRKRQEMDSLFDWPKLQNETLSRMFRKAADIGTSIVTDSAKQLLLAQLRVNMSRIISIATVEHPETKKQIPLAPDVTGLMANPNVGEPVKKLLWQRWRDASGKPVKKMFQQFVDLSNEMIKQAGYDNFAKYWQSWYEPKEGQNFEKMLSDLFQELLPFYKELHSYMRHALKQKYGADVFPPTGHIPGHLLGHMWGGRWDDLEPFTKLFPNETNIDITKEMRNKNWTVRKIFETSENFFASLGLGNMTETFWKKSVIERPSAGVSMVCHASAWDFYTNAGDFRIKQCTEVDGYFLAVTHHEMGHIQYYQQYEQQAVVFRGGANPGFHEAIGDTIELSVMTPSHLRMIGLLTSNGETDEFYINFLYLMALKKAAYLPFGYLIDQWRYKVFKGEVSKDQYNTEWVNLRCQLMGVSSPVLRSEEDFDPGSIYHVVANVEYMRYFISLVLQFQFHKSLCNAAGITENLHKCSIYNNAAAGAKLKALLQKGSSVHWEDALFDISGTRTISAKPLLEYFEPLRSHIRAVNARNKVVDGWDSKCPTADWYNKSSDRLGSWWGLQALVLAIAIRFMIFLL